jgi:tetratricopeptide (TPR) repeat protein
MPKTGHRTGQSLLTFLDGGPSRAIYSETFYPRFHFGWSDMHSLIDGNDHYIRAPQAELFNLAADPGEKKNLIDGDRRTYTRMRAAIEPFVKEAAAPTTYDPEEVAKLAALGYVGSTVQTQSGQELPDPKTRLGDFQKIRLAYTYHRNNDEPAALRLTTELLASNGQIVDLWDLKSKILYQMKDKRGALESAKEGLHQNPGAIALLFDVANLSLANGDLDAAQQHAEIAAKIEPGQAHEILARMWIERHNSERAEQEARLAMQTVNDPTVELMILSGIDMDRGNYKQVLADLDPIIPRLKERTPPRLSNFHLTRGEALARLGRGEEAEKEFRAEMADFPEDPRAYSSLVMLLATEHRLDEATQVVFAAIKAAPTAHTYTIIAETLKAIGDDRGALFWADQGLQHFPQDAELRQLPKRLVEVTPLLRSQMMK